MIDSSISLPPSIDLAAWQQAETDTSVLVLNGHDIRVVVRNGQLSITDGPPGQQRTRTIAKIPRTVSRLLFLAGHGLLSVEAIRWLDWASIPWTVLDTDSGEIISISGPKSQNARLIRAQSRAYPGENLDAVGLEITRYLLTVKLDGQASVIDKHLAVPDASEFIRARAHDLSTASSTTACMALEGRAAEYYWAAWTGRVAVPFSPQDLIRVPSHWSDFAQRYSLSGSYPPNKGATDPVNAILNYLYRVAETECTHACHAYGLHPALGVSHADKPGRDSMALDLLEVARPVCDRIALDLLAPDGMIPYKNGKPQYTDRRWLEETRNGTVRLVPPFTHQLASYAAELAAAIRPHARHVAELLAHAGEGVIRIPHIKGDRKGYGEIRHIDYPAARLRPGVKLTDVIPDHLWTQIEPLLPDLRGGRPVKRGPKHSMSPREMTAVLTLRYICRVPWKDVPANLMTVKRWLEVWESCGAWPKIAELVKQYGHLDTLVSP